MLQRLELVSSDFIASPLEYIKCDNDAPFVDSFD